MTTLCLHQLFQQQAKQTPNAVAVVDDNTTLTYQELDQQSDSLAGYLQKEGLGLDKNAGIFMDKCAEYVVAYVAILKAGGAYMPLDLAYPDSLLGKILSEAKPEVVFTKTRYVERLAEEQSATILNMDLEASYQEGEYDQEAGNATNLDNLAFVVYSSGTTGEPKGISMPHRGPVHSYLNRYKFSSYQPGDRVACNIFFVWELMRPLLKGGSVYPIPDEIIYDPIPLLNFIERNKITEMLFTPSLLETIMNTVSDEALLKKLASLQVLWLNGEVVTTKLKHRMIRKLPKRIRLLNTYSISECHDVANEDLRITEDLSSGICPVGQPIEGVEIKLLDEAMNPSSSEGELYVSGPGVARGYLDKPELTAERFVVMEGKRFYKTGDWAILHSNGKLEITGRCDYMVKMRGYSVHLGAIEAVLLEHADVKSCAVIAEGEEGTDKRLVAYVVRQKDATWKIDENTGTCVAIRDRIKPLLAHFMIPSIYVELEQIPLHNVTGKLNRKELPIPPRREKMNIDDVVISDNPSREEQERVLSILFERILLLEPGSIKHDSNLFDFGGHSLLAVELAVAIEKFFGVQPAVKDLYDHPTVSTLVDFLNNGHQEAPRLSLHEDAILEPEVVPASEVKPLSLKEAKSVFLTGVTGFLGAFLLNELLEQTDDEVKIYALVRAKSGSLTEGLQRITDNLKQFRLWAAEKEKRIVPVIGDLTKKYLGLSPEQFQEYAEKIDIIFHCAALVNYVYSYQVLKPSMVTGTHEILRLACTSFTKPLHYISTNGIFPGDDETPYLENDQIDDYADRLEGGYGPGKWVAEKLVWKAIARGLPVCLYRPGNIGHHSQTGVVNPNDFQFMIIDACKKVNCAPNNKAWAFEMTPIDFLVRAIIRFAKDTSHFGKVYNVVQANPPSAIEVFEGLAQQSYFSEFVSTDLWKAKLLAKADEENDSILRVLAQSLEDVELYLLDTSVYDCTHFDKATSNYGIQRPATDDDYFNKLISTEGYGKH